MYYSIAVEFGGAGNARRFLFGSLRVTENKGIHGKLKTWQY